MGDYDGDGSAPADEKKELKRIFGEGYAAKMSVGSVHVYLLRPDGRLFDSLHVAEAAKPDVLYNHLEAGARTTGVAPGEPLIPPANVAQRCKPQDGALVLHVVARREGRGSWGEFPGENWIVFSEAEARKLGGAGARIGESREIEPEVAYKIFRHVHPQTEDCSDADRNKVEKQSLRATVAAIDGGTTRLRLDGSLRMKRTFYPNHDDDKRVDAALVGYADVRDGRVVSFRLVTDSAKYAKENFSVAVREVGR
jgi:hypothetical protein